MLLPLTPWETVVLAVTATSGRIALPARSSQVVVTSDPASDVAFIRFGHDNEVVAVVPDGSGGAYPIQPGSSQTFTVGSQVTHIAAVCGATESATLWISNGVGL